MPQNFVNTLVTSLDELQKEEMAGDLDFDLIITRHWVTAQLAMMIKLWFYSLFFLETARGVVVFPTNDI